MRQFKLGLANRSPWAPIEASLQFCVRCVVLLPTCRLGLFLFVAPSKESSGRDARE